jgi:hypothetical protein
MSTMELQLFAALTTYFAPSRGLSGVAWAEDDE